MKKPTQEAVLGSLLGLAIGDALGMPVTGLTPKAIAQQFGEIRGYHGRAFPDGAELKAGEFTDETEIALCIVETYTSSFGELDPELIGARMRFLAQGESRRWMAPDTLLALGASTDRGARDEPDISTELATRGVPIGLIHSAGVFGAAAMRLDVETVVGISHQDKDAVIAATVAAEAVRLAITRTVDQSALLMALATSFGNEPIGELLAIADGLLQTGAGIDQITAENQPAIEIEKVVLTAMVSVAKAVKFEEAVFMTAGLGGAADSRAALAGAVAGAFLGAGGIPQELIDGLEGRIYLTLAAPWFYRTIQMKSGQAIGLGTNGHH